METYKTRKAHKGKVPREDVELIQWLYKNTKTNLTDLGKRFKVSPTTIDNIVMRRGAYEGR